eukprot:GHVS01053807.1.p1 GENE.GHVS01053807.1~~GHVS01053807.1.p1  ORF type:complete len:385 (-),score=26.00 GHVS01053807.1:64-1218(-)
MSIPVSSRAVVHGENVDNAPHQQTAAADQGNIAHPDYLSMSCSPYQPQTNTAYDEGVEVCGQQSNPNKLSTFLTRNIEALSNNPDKPIYYGEGISLIVYPSPEVRLCFVREMYAILSVQLLYSFAFGLVFSLYVSAQHWLLANWVLALTSIIVGFCLIGVMRCFASRLANRRTYSYILIAVATFGLSWMNAFCGLMTSTSAFAIAAGITTAVCIGLSIFSIQTKWDFTRETGCSVYKFASLLLLTLILGIVAAIVQNNILSIIYYILITVVFSLTLIYDTQQVVGGTSRQCQYPLDVLQKRPIIFNFLLFVYIFFLQLSVALTCGHPTFWPKTTFPCYFLLVFYQFHLVFMPREETLEHKVATVLEENENQKYQSSRTPSVVVK